MTTLRRRRARERASDRDARHSADDTVETVTAVRALDAAAAVAGLAGNAWLGRRVVGYVERRLRPFHFLADDREMISS